MFPKRHVSNRLVLSLPVTNVSYPREGLFLDECCGCVDWAFISNLGRTNSGRKALQMHFLYVDRAANRTKRSVSRLQNRSSAVQASVATSLRMAGRNLISPPGGRGHLNVQHTNTPRPARHTSRIERTTEIDDEKRTVRGRAGQ